VSASRTAAPQESAPTPASGRAALAACPCGRLDARQRPRAYAGCCGRYLDDFAHHPAPDAESLMRSRYTAFAHERADYLLATWHVSHRPASIAFDAGTRWLGLQVKGHWQADVDHAEVEFVARQRDAAGRAHRLHERSRFLREAGRWYYLDAVG
jgi:SEC-C motif-containing protein